MLKSFRAPITTPAVVTSYYEPSTHNDLSLVGGNRGAITEHFAHLNIEHGLQVVQVGDMYRITVPKN